MGRPALHLPSPSLPEAKETHAASQQHVPQGTWVERDKCSAVAHVGPCPHSLCVHHTHGHTYACAPTHTNTHTHAHVHTHTCALTNTRAHACTRTAPECGSRYRQCCGNNQATRLPVGGGDPGDTQSAEPACGSHRHAHTASQPASQHGATSYCCSDPARAPRGPRAGQSETQGLAGAPPPQSRAFCLTCDVSHRPAHPPPWCWFKPQPCRLPPGHLSKCYHTTPCLSFLLCEMGVMTGLTEGGHEE